MRQPKRWLMPRFLDDGGSGSPASHAPAFGFLFPHACTRSRALALTFSRARAHWLAMVLRPDLGAWLASLAIARDCCAAARCNGLYDAWLARCTLMRLWPMLRLQWLPGFAAPPCSRLSSCIPAINHLWTLQFIKNRRLIRRDPQTLSWAPI